MYRLNNLWDQEWAKCVMDGLKTAGEVKAASVLMNLKFLNVRLLVDN
jgi:hypothetical protein